MERPNPDDRPDVLPITPPAPGPLTGLAQLLLALGDDRRHAERPGAEPAPNTSD